MNAPPEAPDAPEAKASAASTEWVGIAIVWLSTLFVALFVLQSRPLQSANDRSRWCTVWSLVERGTYHIDEIDRVPEWSTIDKVRHRAADDQPWHFYSSKPPLFSTAVAGLYWIERHTLGYDLRNDGLFVSRLLLLMINVIPWCLALHSFRRSLSLVGVNGLPQWLILLAAGFGSMLSPFLTTLNNHTPAAICLCFCLSAIVRIFVTQQQTPKDFAIIGSTAALVVCFELPAALFGVVSFLIVAFVDWRKTLKAYIPAAIVPLAAFFVTNWICTGGIKPFYAYYGTEKYVYVHEGIPSYWTNPQGIDANSESTSEYLFHCILGHHGLLSMTPIFLLTLFGWLLLFKRGSYQPGSRVVVVVGAALSAAVLAFYLSRTQNYNYGGNSAALRWMLWLTPFWWYAMIPPVIALSRSRSGIALICILLSFSAYSSMYSINRPWQPGWVYRQMFSAGMIDYRTRIEPFEPTRYSILKTIDEARTAEWISGTAANQQTLRIQSFRQVVAGPQRFIPLQLDYVSETEQQTAMLAVHLDSFENGDDITTWLRSAPDSFRDDNPEVVTGDLSNLSPASKWAVDLLRGLPMSRAYNAETPRFLKYNRRSGEKWALKCERGAARVAFMDSTEGQCSQRCDVYYSDEVPFGVAAWFVVVRSQNDSRIIRTEKWVARQLPE